MASNDYEDLILETQNSHNVPAESVALKSDTAEGVEEAAAVPGGKLHCWVAVSFCLLCILQATLNISLRFILSSQQNALITERDELKEILKDFETQQNTLITERDGLKEKLKDISSQQNALITERDELKEILKDFETQQNTLITEKDKLKEKLRDIAEYTTKGWVYFKNSFYYISTMKTTWQESRNFCQQYGADLVVINSKEEQEFTRLFTKEIWIGLTDHQSEGTWKWVDGTPLTKSYWGNNEPNNDFMGTDEDCVETNFVDVENNWNDVPCDERNYWICEKTAVLVQQK